MIFQKVIVLLKFLLILSFQLNAQELSLCTTGDKMSDLFRAYKYKASDAFNIVDLCLYKDYSFTYTVKTFNQDVFSNGKWRIEGDTLIIVNKMVADQLPVRLIYSQDSSDLIDGFKISIVRNLKGAEMPDGLVAINNEANICLPSYGGICKMEFKSIDSIKVIFENGFKSPWIRITEDKYQKIIPIVQTDYLISSFMFFDERRYLIKSTELVPLF